MNIQLKTLIMKTKIILLVGLISLSFTSCIKDYLGHGDDENDTGFLTETNYLYADDLKVAFLEDNLDKLFEEKAFLDQVFDAGQANEEQKERYEEVGNEIEATSNTISSLFDIRETVFKIVGPKPPCPRPRLCDEWLNMIYVTPRPDYTKYQLSVYSSDDELLGQSIGEPGELLGVDGAINYVDFVWNTKDYKGEILVKSYGVTDKGMEEFAIIYSSIN